MVHDLMKNILGEKLSGPDYSKCDIGNLILIDRGKQIVSDLYYFNIHFGNTYVVSRYVRILLRGGGTI
jgi:hypothetical protein